MNSPIQPAVFDTYYGVGVMEWGEDGEIGLIALGHGPRALAALNAYQRSVDGRNWHRTYGDVLPEKWVVWVDSCDHTPDEHATHDWAAGDCDECDLPPCSDRFDITYRDAAEGDTGAVQITEVIW